MSPPYATGRRAKLIFALLSEDMSAIEKYTAAATDAHAAKNDRDFYAAVTKLRKDRAKVQKVLDLLKQGLFDQAEKEMGLAGLFNKGDTDA